MTKTAHPETDTSGVAEKQRRIQSEQDSKDAAKSKDKGQKGKQAKPAVQAGAREQPREMPAQHLAKPGLEADLELEPRFMAPDYEGSHKLQDRVTLITGGDSGIGRAVAVLYAREGADVAIVYLDEHEDAQKTARCVEAEGRRCLLIPGDVKDAGFCRQAVQQTVDEFGQLDVLVNNAAFQEHAESLEDITEERFDETLRTNVYGYFHMAKAALPHLKQGASIINTGSVTGLEGSARLLDYSTTKGAIHAFTKALASNLLEKGIRVNAVAPGPVWTPLNPADSPAEKVKDFGKKTDMKRAAQPEELSPAYVFLAAPSCSGYITGIVLPVTGSVGAI
ncbi:MAG: SDR family oxidoreductase [Methylibium sp.]|uniref:SDR family oxidoreductase n=1 Tax=Methylibium sp. TaxID=2067992 RepID=UPI0017F44CBB|nr:SDR family oxidoreductase [Methylibium sp.]MBA3596173.1 SDR family oxidoreductase [Methylibium sp.]